MSPAGSRWRAAALTLIAVSLEGACAGDATGPRSTQPQIARLQLSVANQIVAIDGNGQMSNGPIVLRADVDVEIEATFLRQNGTRDPLVTATDYALNVMLAGGTAVITFARSATDPFAGTLRCNFANTSGTLWISLRHVAEEKDYWGPFEAAVTVIN